MAEREMDFADIMISVAAAEFQLQDWQNELLDRHQKIFADKLGDRDPSSREAKRLFVETMREVDGATEVYELIDVLTDFNLETLLKGKTH